MDEKELHKLVLSKCPIRDTVGELKNPSGVYAEEYSRIWNEIKSEMPKQNPSLLKKIKNIFNK